MKYVTVWVTAVLRIVSSSVGRVSLHWCPPWRSHPQSIARPRSIRRHHQVADCRQGAVIVDAPACKVLPGLFAIRLQREPGGLQLLQRLIEFRPVDADRIVGKARILRIGYLKEIGDAPERQEAGTDAQRRRRLIGHVDRRKRHRRRVQHRAGCRDPRELRARRAEEDQCRQSGVAFLDVGEPGLPCAPVVTEPIESMNAMEPLEHLHRRGRCAGAHLQQVDGLLAP